MQDTAGEAGTSSLVMYSNGPLHMAEQKQGNQLEPTYSSSVRIRGVALRTCRKRWTIGRVKYIRADSTTRWDDERKKNELVMTRGSFSPAVWT